MAKVIIEIEAENATQEQEARASLQRLVDKIKAAGVIKLTHKYETDTFVKMAVNKVLSSKK